MSICPGYSFHGKKHSWRAKLSSRFRKEALKQPTEAERQLLEQLKPLLKRKSRIYSQKVIFTPKSFYLGDLCLKAFKVIIEVDGQYHNNPDQKLLDDQKTAEFNRRGYDLIRVTNDEVFNNIAIPKIFSFLENAGYLTASRQLTKPKGKR